MVLKILALGGFQFILSTSIHAMNFYRNLTLTKVVQAWRGMTSDHAPQHATKIILGALSSRILDIKIAHLVLIFKLQH